MFARCAGGESYFCERSFNQFCYKVSFFMFNKNVILVLGLCGVVYLNAMPFDDRQSYDAPRFSQIKESALKSESGLKNPLYEKCANTCEEIWAKWDNVTNKELCQQQCLMMVMQEMLKQAQEDKKQNSLTTQAECETLAALMRMCKQVRVRVIGQDPITQEKMVIDFGPTEYGMGDLLCAAICASNHKKDCPDCKTVLVCEKERK